MRWAIIAALLVCIGAAKADSPPNVVVGRVPGGGVEPQMLVDSRGVLHLLYFKGTDKAGDLFYYYSKDGGRTFAGPGSPQVNSVDKSATIVGAVRGPQMALGRDGRAFVIWTGNDSTQPNPRLAGLPLLFSRFEPREGQWSRQKRVIESGVGIDGGASITANSSGEVDIVWHAPEKKGQDEQSRRLWVARSKDDGQTFAPPTMLDTPPLGACGCCANLAFTTNDGALSVLYRTADEMIHRDMMLVSLDAALKPTAMKKLSEWNVGKCVMSTSSEASGVIAWESEDQILITRVDSKAPTKLGKNNPKHPRVAVSGDHVLLAWTEETGWNKGGKLAWQLLDRELKPIEGESGERSNQPVWDYPAVAALADGSFLILY